MGSRLGTDEGGESGDGGFGDAAVLEVQIFERGKRVEIEQQVVETLVADGVSRHGEGFQLGSRERIFYGSHVLRSEARVRRKMWGTYLVLFMIRVTAPHRLQAFNILSRIPCEQSFPLLSTKSPGHYDKLRLRREMQPSK